MGVEWEHGEKSWWRSAYCIQHGAGIEFIGQSQWWGNNGHSSKSPFKGQTVKTTAPHMLCPTKAFKAKHSLCVTQALTKAYTLHYEQQTISWGRHDITRGIILALWQYVRRSKSDSIPIGSFNRVCTHWLPSSASPILHYHCICYPYLPHRQRNPQYATRMPAERQATKMNLSHPPWGG